MPFFLCIEAFSKCALSFYFSTIKTHLIITGIDFAAETDAACAFHHYFGNDVVYELVAGCGCTCEVLYGKAFTASAADVIFP